MKTKKSKKSTTTCSNKFKRTISPFALFLILTMQISNSFSQTGNTATGYYALNSNTTGNFNTATGEYALYFNTTGSNNVANGVSSLYKNNTGSFNTATGENALYSNTMGGNNTTYGYMALYGNSTGYNNTANGYQALYSNSIGYNNIASGYQALYTNTTGSYNTAIGYHADVSGSGLTNATAIGANASVSESNALVLGKAANVGIGTSTPGLLLDVNAGLTNIAQVRIISSGTDAAISFKNTNSKATHAREYWWDSGSGSAGVGAGNFAVWDVTANATRIVIDSTGRFGIGTTTPSYMLTVNGKPGANGYTQFTNYSDARLKNNIKNIDNSLDKIMQLHPVQFNYNDEYLNLYNDTNSLAIVRKGFIAQEVKEIFPEMVGTVKIKEKEYYDLNLSNLQVYMVKAIQELNAKNEKLQSEMTETVKQLENKITQLQTDLSSCCNAKGTSGLNTENKNSDDNNIAAVLYQNNPNPFSQQTQIKCFVPENAMVSYICIYDMQGKQLQKLQINGKGEVSEAIQGSEFKSGMYMYTLIIDGKLIDTKRMVLTD